MNTINKILILISVNVFLLLTACEKKPIDIIDPLETIEVEIQDISENPLIKEVGKMASNGFALHCITFNYPFAFKLESGATLTINNNNEAEVAIYNEEDYVIDFVYPLEATDNNGDMFIIDSEYELSEEFITCIPEDGWGVIKEERFPAFDFDDLCVELSYPFVLQSYDEALTMEVNNEQEFAEAIASEYYYFSFPINVVYIDGNTLAIEDDIALMNTLFDCDIYNGYYYEYFPFDFIFCFELVYPVGLIDEAGNVSPVDNLDELYNLLFSSGAVDFVYPVTLISEDGTTVEANDAAKIDNLLEDCFNYEDKDYPPFYFYEFCFGFDYPVDFMDASGNTHTANNGDELFERIYSGEIIDFVYPVAIILEDGATKTVSSLSEFNKEIEMCFGYLGDDYYYYPPFYYFAFCFAIDYPIQWIDADGNSYAVDNDIALNEVIYSGEMVDLVYPITVTLQDGTAATANNANELNSLSADCGYEDYPIDEPEFEEETIFDLLLLDKSNCYTINYPIKITVNNEAQAVNDDAAMEEIILELISTELLMEAEINYPITVTLQSDGSIITINEELELLNYIENCP